MIPHLARRPTLVALAMLLTAAVAGPLGATRARADTPQTSAELVRAMANARPDDCDLLPGDAAQPEAVTTDLQRRVFDTLEAELAARLNAPAPASAAEAPARVTALLRDVEATSAEIDKAWPDDDRFHFQVLAVSPAVVVALRYRSQAVAILFGSYDPGRLASQTPGNRWRTVERLGDIFSDATDSDARLFALHRGPGGRARFLVSTVRAGCAGSVGEAYYGYEWASEDGEIAREVLKIEGAEGLYDDTSVHVGALKTTGPAIELPYCFFSPVDTWDNPTLCAADTFDLSGDAVRFTGRRYNRPDLVTVVRAIQYAQAHDTVALRGYCASDAVARGLERDAPPGVGAEDLQTRKAGPGRETVILSDAVRFDLVRRQGRWLVAGFRIAPES